MTRKESNLPPPRQASGSSTAFQVERFFGVVYLKDWLAYRDGRNYRVIAGWLSILQDERILGFKTRGTESNWCARVESASGMPALNILGCQIRAVEVVDPADFEVHQDTLSLANGM